MLIKFEAKPRQFAVGDRVVILPGAPETGWGASLHGDHRVVRITRTHYHVAVPHYKARSRYRIDTGIGPDWGGSGIVSVAEAREQQAAFRAGKAARLNDNPKDPGYKLRFGSGEI